MKIEIRNVKHFAAGSEETACFTATVYVDGKKVGTAQNHGTGGPTMIHPFGVEQQINEYAATLPQKSLDMGDGHTVEYKQTAESIIDDLLSQHLLEKDLRKLLVKRIVFTAIDAKGVFQSKAYPAEVLKATLAHPDLRAKWKIKDLLNTLPFSEALAIYAAQAKA